MCHTVGVANVHKQLVWYIDRLGHEWCRIVQNWHLLESNVTYWGNRELRVKKKNSRTRNSSRTSETNELEKLAIFAYESQILRNSWAVVDTFSKLMVTYDFGLRRNVGMIRSYESKSWCPLQLLNLEVKGIHLAQSRAYIGSVFSHPTRIHQSITVPFKNSIAQRTHTTVVTFWWQ